MQVKVVDAAPSVVGGYSWGPYYPKVDVYWSYTHSTVYWTDDVGVVDYHAEIDGGNPLPDWLSYNAANKTFYGLPPATYTATIRVFAYDVYE